MFTVFITIIQNYVCDLWNCITVIYVFFQMSKRIAWISS